MKKIFTLLAAAAVAVSAFAMPTDLTHSRQLTHKLDATKVESSNLKVIKSTRIVDKNTNKQWTCVLSMSTPWWEGLGVDMVEYPYMRVIVVLNADDGNNSFQYDMTWPLYGALNNACMAEDEDGQPYLNTEAVTEIYGADKVGVAMSYDDFVAEAGDGLFFCLDSFYYTPCIVAPTAIYSDPLSATINGTACMPNPCTITSTGTINYQNGMYLDWSAFDEEASEADIQTSGKYVTEAGSTSYITFEGDFSGDAILFGLANINWDSVGEVHIFNGGRQEFGDDYTWDYDEFEGALNYYYLAFFDKNSCSYDAVLTATNEKICAYSDTELPDGYMIQAGRSYTGSPFMIGNDWDWFGGAIWASENTEFPYGVWTMDELDPEQLYGIPEANKLMYKGYSERDGLNGCFNSYFQTGLPGSQIGVGDKNLGLNFKIYTQFTGEKYIYGTYKGSNILFHNVPDAWTSKIESLPICSNDGDYNVITGGNVAVEAVESDAPVVSRSFYNFQGQRLNAEPETGMYIIRSVKADGTVKATKVAK